MARVRNGMSVPEAAVQLELSHSTVRAMIKAGLLHAFRPSGFAQGHFRIPAEEIERVKATQSATALATSDIPAGAQ